MTDREVAMRVLWAAWGRPYRWGGDDPMAGFDCSGLVNEVLYSTGKLSTRLDLTAQRLFDFAAFPVVNAPSDGVLVFWGRDAEHVTHVEMCLDEHRSMGAGGGGSTVATVADAIKANAYVRVRMLADRPGIVGYRDPFSV